LFPSYEARFRATGAFDLSSEPNRLSFTDTHPLTMPVLLLISTDAHPAFSPVAGGPPAEIEWRRRFPRAVVVHVKSTHLTIPYTAETAWSILHFLVSIRGEPFRLDAILAGQEKFAQINRVMESARESFRRSWREKHANTDFAHRLAATLRTESAVIVRPSPSIEAVFLASAMPTLRANGYDDVTCLFCMERDALFAINADYSIAKMVAAVFF